MKGPHEARDKCSRSRRGLQPAHGEFSKFVESGDPKRRSPTDHVDQMEGGLALAQENEPPLEAFQIGEIGGLG